MFPTFPDSEPKPEDSRWLQGTEALLALARAGDQEAKHKHFEHFTPVLERFLHARMPPHLCGVHDTDDLVQEVIVRALAHFADFEHRGPGSFWGYLRRIGLNHVAEVVRRQGVGAEPRALDGSTLDGVDPSLSPSRTVLQREQFERVELALQELSEVQRQSVEMRMELCATYEQIAEECGFPSPDAARMAVKRAYQRLAQRLSHDGQ